MKFEVWGFGVGVGVVVCVLSLRLQFGLWGLGLHQIDYSEKGGGMTIVGTTEWYHSVFGAAFLSGVPLAPNSRSIYKPKL